MELLKWVGNSVKNGSVWLATDTSHLAKISETMMPLETQLPYSQRKELHRGSLAGGAAAGPEWLGL